MPKLEKSGGTKMSAEHISFEKSLDELKGIVEDLENGDLPLNESLERFQSGISLIKQCYKELQTAELKIETIIKKDGKIITETLDKK